MKNIALQSEDHNHETKTIFTLIPKVIKKYFERNHIILDDTKLTNLTIISGFIYICKYTIFSFVF